MGELSKPISSGAISGIREHIVGVRVAVVAAAVVGLALLAPVLWMAVSAGLGLIALGAVGLAGLGFFQALPLLGQRMENKILGLRKAEARRRPIEQIQNSILERDRRLESYGEAVTRIGAKIKSRAQAVQERAREKSSYDPARHLAALATASGAHAKMVSDYQACSTALANMREKLDDAQFDWEFSEDFIGTKQDIKAASGQDLLDGILVDESFKAVRDQYNSVFASLELNIQTINSTQQLTYDNGDMVIDLSDIKVKELVKR